MPTLTDLSTIRDLCARYDFALSKGFGQNFIINPGICPRIAEAAGIGPGWGALEVGPGIGVLTEQLCKRADNVVSIEVDKRLPPLLAETLAEYENVTLLDLTGYEYESYFLCDTMHLGWKGWLAVDKAIAEFWEAA